MTFLGLLGWRGSILAVPILTYAVDFGAKKAILRGPEEGGGLHVGRGERGVAMGMRGVLVSILCLEGRSGDPPVRLQGRLAASRALIGKEEPDER
jgi:hypothetical protein